MISTSITSHIKGGPEWDPGVYRGYIKRIISDPGCDRRGYGSCWISTCTKMGQAVERSSRIPPVGRSRHRGVWGMRRISFVEGMIVQLSQEARLSNRVAFRHVAQAVRFP